MLMSFFSLSFLFFFFALGLFSLELSTDSYGFLRLTERDASESLPTKSGSCPGIHSRYRPHVLPTMTTSTV